MDTDLANQVFAHLGVPTVSSTTDNVEHMRRLLGLADTVRRKVLSEAPWPFAIKRFTLTAEVTAPVFGYTYSLPLPGDFIRLVSLPNYDTGNSPYTIEGEKLLADSNSVQLIYVADIDGTLSHLWPPEFRHVLSLCYAATLATAIMGSASRGDALWAQYSSALTRATAVSGKSAGPLALTCDVLLNAARGYVREHDYM